ncbi:MAG: hypothetical protein DRN96_09115 [Thermoproteota archaeon]|nr:MAG: hypothetical protein DRN96_09115 [Candidatus Korarchaeota archaeon]
MVEWVSGLLGEGRGWRLFFLAVFLCIVSSSAFGVVRRLGDASSHWMICSSILYDRDLVYDVDRDLRRALEHRFDDLPSGIFLMRKGGRYVYAKSVHYAVFCAPFFLLLGGRGFLLANGLMFVGTALAVGSLVSRLRGVSGEHALLFALACLLLSNFYALVYWIDPFVFLGFLLALSYYLWFSGRKAASGVVLGFASSYRFLEAPLLLPLLAWDLADGKLRDAAVVFASFASVFSAVLAFNYVVFGSYAPYAAGVYYLTSLSECFDPATGVFDNCTLPLLPRALPGAKVIAYNVFYLFLGRKSGVLVYNLPALLAFMSAAKGGRVERSIVVVCLLDLLALAVLRPTLYQGGYHTVGNRYFTFYPVLLLAADLRRLDRRAVAAVLAASALLAAPVNANPVMSSLEWRRVGYSYPYRAFPLELTVLGLDYDLSGEGFVLHYADLNSYMAEESGFWTRGGSEAVFIVRAVRRGKLFISLTNGLYRNAVEVSVGGERRRVELGSFEGTTLEFEAEPELKYTSYWIYGRESRLAEIYVYTVRVRCTASWIPALTGHGSDPRCLGVYVQVSVGG